MSRVEETEHFFRRRQEKVAKIVQCGEPRFPNNLKEKATAKWPLVFVTWIVT